MDDKLKIKYNQGVMNYYKNNKKSKLALEAIKCLGEARNDFNAKYMRKILTNLNALEPEVDLERARKINESKNEFI